MKKPVAMNQPELSLTIREAYQQHLFRQQGIMLCKQLISLVIEIQKHRGCTLAILSGDHFFETQLYGIQRDITDKLRQLDTAPSALLQASDRDQIIQEWVCLRRLWRKDTVQENFLLHSNLIAGLLKTIWQVTHRARLTGISETQDTLVTFCMRDWLHMIETSAQARGLATHVAVCRSARSDIRSRIRFLYEQMRALDRTFIEHLDDFEARHSTRIKEATERADYRQQLDTFLKQLSLHFCETDKPNIDADSIYTLGSHLVSACQIVLLAAIKLIEKTLSPELAAWVDGDDHPPENDSTILPMD